MPMNPFDDSFSPGGGSFSDLFARPKVVGSGRRVPAKPAAASKDDDEPLEAAPEETPAQEDKPKVTLKNPKWEVEEVGFNEETDISIEAVIPEAHAHKTKVAFELFAKTPDGPESISKADGQAKEGKARARVPVYMPSYKDEEGNLLGKVEYFFTAKHSESDLFKDEKATKTIDHIADRLIDSHVLEDATFATGKSFPKTDQAGDLKALGAAVKAWRDKHPEAKLAVFGHADAVGREQDNKTLSERRGRALHAFLAKDPAAWEALYGEEKWGLSTTQELLRHLGHDPGAIDGADGPKTQAAVKEFQGKKGLTADGVAGPKTREALYLAYMEACESPASKAKEFDAIDGNPYAGCSEFNLAKKTDGACEENRRVAVLLLKSNRNFPIQYPCKKGDIGPCRKQAERKGDRKNPGFKCLFYDQLVKEEKKGGGGGRKQALAGTLNLVGLKEGEEVKQYVNIKPEMPELGPERLIEVTVEGAADGTKVFWKATAAKENSARSDPKPGLKADAKGKLAELKAGVAELETEVKGGKASCVLACGLAGGDRFTVEAGLEKGKAGGMFTVVNWRKLWYETIQPVAEGANPVTGFTFFNPDKKPGLSENSIQYLARILGKGYVEFDQRIETSFEREDLPHAGKYNVFDGQYAGKGTRKNFCVLTFSQLDSILASKAKLQKDQRGVSIIWTDYLAKMVKWEESFNEISIGGEVRSSLSLFERAVDRMGGHVHGSYAVKRIKWKATHWMDNEIGDWMPIASPNHPGWAHRHGGSFDSEEDIRAHLEFRDMRHIAFKFPDSNPAYPGKRIGRDETGRLCEKGVNIAISLAIEGVACSTNINGAALNGDIWMNTFAGEVHEIGVAGVIAHELGHNMGQAYADVSIDPAFGRPKSKPIPGIPFPKGVPEGEVYGEHGHRGTHCAKGVVDKTAKDFDSSGSNAFNEHTCIMFGASDMEDSKEFEFCPDCLTYIRAENLEDIRKSWSA